MGTTLNIRKNYHPFLFINTHPKLRIFLYSTYLFLNKPSNKQFLIRKITLNRKEVDITRFFFKKWSLYERNITKQSKAFILLQALIKLFINFSFEHIECITSELILFGYLTNPTPPAIEISILKWFRIRSTYHYLLTPLNSLVNLKIATVWDGL